MEFPDKYKCLKQNIFSKEDFKLIPIRYEDRFLIMNWRNEQMYHLRQIKPLTILEQDKYFSEIVFKLFGQRQPAQILFSYLENDVCIGYGGLVHINWIDRNAEISFIMDTMLEADFFWSHWSTFLSLIEQVGFNELKLHKIYTYAFDLRPHLYKTIEGCGYIHEATLKEHFFFEGKFIDIIIHSKVDFKVILRKVTISDLDITFQWATDPLIRKYSLTTRTISFEEHKRWFINKIQDSNCIFYIIERNNAPAGLIRFDINANNEAMISYLVSPDFQGQGLGKMTLYEGVKKIFDTTNVNVAKGIVLKKNIASLKIFEALGYEREDVNGQKVLFSKRKL
jgi:RimJ/RimL family protein N-acetyltransferase